MMSQMMNACGGMQAKARHVCLEVREIHYKRKHFKCDNGTNVKVIPFGFSTTFWLYFQIGLLIAQSTTFGKMQAKAYMPCNVIMPHRLSLSFDLSFTVSTKLIIPRGVYTVSIIHFKRETQK